MKDITSSIPAPSKNSRPIKFRAWDIPIKRMLPVVDISFRFDYREDIDGPVSGVTVQGDGHEILLNYILMQFTGLLDKNGKEIYEGDIVKYFWDKEEKEFHDNPVVVEWNPDIGGWILTDAKDDWFDGLLYKNPTYKIIGNIYENSELIAKSNNAG